MAHVDALSRMPVVAAIEQTDVDMNIQITQTRDESIREIRDKLEVGDLEGYILENGLVFVVAHRDRHNYMFRQNWRRVLCAILTRNTGTWA